MKGLQLDREIAQLRTKRRRATERRRLEQREKLSEKVRPAEISRVQVLRRHRMVKVYAASDNRVRPHLKEMKYHVDELKILRIERSHGGEEKSEAVSYTLTFGSNEGFDKYLEFTGWQDLPDES
ncbi:MAG: hypothetical protein AVDCRST_MAG01-01-4503 [uncultured Rubrobacteraceae bacterium]|uniref:Uncharacterized protein n=1 Tax=uncultured Rubrobacteraceae bacterium TaxID=349277 RepID=A0A6J4QNR9_9ACTN|nr:MAG: hypothetical protein AVDCRST_MAG01-01-4503 [uncultured Rubrobacteraceae bacterium]